MKTNKAIFRHVTIFICLNLNASFQNIDDKMHNTVFVCFI